LEFLTKMWQTYMSVTSLDEAKRILAERGEKARIVAGATDLILEIERKVRIGIETLIDITRVPGLDQIILDEDDTIHLGPLVTHNHCAASKLLVERAYPLARAAWEVGAPQIRNRGTVAGNLITASPANDTITPLMAMGASLTLGSQTGERSVPLRDFYTGVRSTVMRPDELLLDIAFPAMKTDRRGTFIKIGLRMAQAISLVNVAILLAFEDEPGTSKIKQANITLGAVAPTIIHAREAEAYLVHRHLDQQTIATAAGLAGNAAHPIDDVRSSADYRMEMVRVGASRALHSLWRGNQRETYPANPVLLWGKQYRGIAPVLQADYLHDQDTTIHTRINGEEYHIRGANHKTLLRLIREDAGLTGTKEGCAEGECGACTVYLDGMAVMSCLVPAPRAHGADIVTIEGLAREDRLHPVQRAFIEEGAVQCGYCTPGFIMSAAKLLEERPQPTQAEIRGAITGNLCRCTGYYSIVKAIEKASQMEVLNG
jgi:xanthine dehydrogenase iron-sulfur cluster and FAD-binding subunit A